MFSNMWICPKLHRDHEYVVTRNVMFRTGLKEYVVNAVFEILVKEKFFFGPVLLPKMESDGSRICYNIGNDHVEWDGCRWIGSELNQKVKIERKSYLSKSAKQKKNCRIVEFDGLGFQFLRYGPPYREYLESKTHVKRKRDTCSRCGARVSHDIRHNRSKSTHSLLECNLLMIKNVMTS